MNRYETPDDAESDIVTRIANKEVVIGFGHPVYTIADPATRSSRKSPGSCRRKSAT